MNLLVLIKIWTAKRHLCLCLPSPPSSRVYGALVRECVRAAHLVLLMLFWPKLAAPVVSCGLAEVQGRGQRESAVSDDSADFYGGERQIK